MYIARIEECFSRYRRHGNILSPQNWLIAERWEQTGIPINIVCKGIKKTCRQFRSTHNEGEERIDILTYCEPEILRLWKDYRKALIGSPDKKPDDASDNSNGEDQVVVVVRKRLEDIRRDFTDTISAADDPWDDFKKMALGQIDWPGALDFIENECFKGEQVDIDLIEKRLSNLDRLYINKLFELIPKEQRDGLAKEAEDDLLPYKGQMEMEIYSETLEISIESLLRERLSLKRISLYAT
ncbi:hypothetical protein JXL19_03675 [bacterium]|nr:hypothetical protein [bacterium]